MLTACRSTWKASKYMVGVSLVFMFVSMHMLLELVLCASYEFVNNFTNFCNRKFQSIFDQVLIKHKIIASLNCLRIVMHDWCVASMFNSDFKQILFSTGQSGIPRVKTQSWLQCKLVHVIKAMNMIFLNFRGVYFGQMANKIAINLSTMKEAALAHHDWLQH